MKSLLLALTLTLSSTAFARQYIQCTIMDDASTDVMVVNLQNEDGGTLFLSSGMQNPETERVLVDIKFDRIEDGHHHFAVINENGKGSVAVPSDLIGKSTNTMIVTLNFGSYSVDFGCFSRIYND